MILTFGGGKGDMESEQRGNTRGNGERERDRGDKTRELRERDSCGAEEYTQVSIEAERSDKAS